MLGFCPPDEITAYPFSSRGHNPNRNDKKRDAHPLIDFRVFLKQFTLVLEKCSWGIWECTEGIAFARWIV